MESDDRKGELLEQFLQLQARKEMWSELGPCNAIMATSDLHIEFPKNSKWLHALQVFPKTCLIVAGDVCTSMIKLENALRCLKNRFVHVFYVPGNHELWLKGDDNLKYPGGDGSIGKFLRILSLCDELGVIWRPAWVSIVSTQGNIEKGSRGYCESKDPARALVMPLFSWYRSTFAEDELTAKYTNLSLPFSAHESSFDAGCKWPSGIGDSAQPNFSLHAGISDYFSECNIDRVGLHGLEVRQHRASLCRVDGSKCVPSPPPTHVLITFSHFLPRPELYPGRKDLVRVMGSYDIDWQLRHCARAVDVHISAGIQVGSGGGSLSEGGSMPIKHIHVFGHSHIPVDCVYDGVHYIQVVTLL